MANDEIPEYDMEHVPPPRRRRISRCLCEDDSVSEDLTPDLSCVCPKDEHDLVKHTEDCIFYRNQTLIFPDDPQLCVCEDDNKICKCCQCPLNKCYCAKVTKDDVALWRQKRPIGAMPAVLDANHPLMQKFQQALKQFLDKENQLAEDEIANLKEDLRLARTKYDTDLETIYWGDHDTNAQRVMIEEYESSLAQLTEDRLQAQEKVRLVSADYEQAKNKLEKSVLTEKENIHELEALNLLCQQMEEWKKETDTEAMITNRMSEKMKQEHATVAADKRRLDMIVYGLSSEVWKLEGNIELVKKQIEIKNAEIDKVKNKVIANVAELEDLDLDKRRLVSLWNAVIVNIKQRDKAYNSVCDDYKNLQENYHTLLLNLDITKKAIMEEMNLGKEIIIQKEKFDYEYNKVLKTFQEEDAKRAYLEAKMLEISEAIDMNAKDQELIKAENAAINYKLSNIVVKVDKLIEKKLHIENQILANLQELFLNDKAFGSMANGIKKLRDISRKQEIALSTIENQHTKVMFQIEEYRCHQVNNDKILMKTDSKVRAKEKAIEDLEYQGVQKSQLMMRKQRELDSITKKYFELKEVFEHKSPQGQRILELEVEIYRMRERTAQLQKDWVRLQIHVVDMATQHHTLATDVNLIMKQKDICAQKALRIEVRCSQLSAEHCRIEKSLRNLRGKLQALERTRYEAISRNKEVVLSTNAFTHKNVANLKEAESAVLQLEQDIEDYEKEKETLASDLDRVQREALIWQRKGILALELKRSMHDAKSAVGEVGQMKTEIHRMEIRREQMRRAAENLSNDLAHVIASREAVLEKSRAQAAADKKHHSSSTSQSQYHYKLKFARADMVRVAKELKDMEERYEFLQKEQERLENETAEVYDQNAKIEEEIAQCDQQGIYADHEKQWLLEQVVRTQRLGMELGKAVKRQSLKLRKPKGQITKEYAQNMMLNERLRKILEILIREFPYLEVELTKIANTLLIHSPTISPSLLTPDCLCGLETCECVRYGCYCPRLEAAKVHIPERDIPHNIEIIEEGVTQIAPPEHEHVPKRALPPIEDRRLSKVYDDDD